MIESCAGSSNLGCLVGNTSLSLSVVAIDYPRLVRKYFWVLELTGRNGDELDVGSEMIHREEESWFCLEIKQNLQVMEAEREERFLQMSGLRLTIRLGNWEQRTGRRVKITYLISMPAGQWSPR